MSTESAPVSTAASPALPVLSMVERRILGVLVEKAKTTPDAYPLSLNALVTGCNQKSNREPLMELSDVECEDTLLALLKRNLVARVTGSRVERWRHLLYEGWQVSKVELAVLAELLLRGPQTEGELRGRASRMEPIDDLDVLREVLRPLAERRLVVYLTPEARRGTVLTHGFHASEELERLRSRHRADAIHPDSGESAHPVPGASRPASDPNFGARLTEAQAEIAALKSQVASLQASVTAVIEEVSRLKQALGG